MRLVRAEALAGSSRLPPAEDAPDHTAITIDGPNHFWGLVLMMAVRDRATSLHYHPWRAGVVTYVTDFTLYELVPPPEAMAGALLDSARALFAPPSLLGRLRRRGVACGSFEFDAYDSLTVWDAVVWSSGPRGGVELYRVVPPEPARPGPSYLELFNELFPPPG